MEQDMTDFPVVGVAPADFPFHEFDAVIHQPAYGGFRKTAGKKTGITIAAIRAAENGNFTTFPRNGPSVTGI